MNRSEAQMGNQNARKRTIRSQENKAGFEEGKKFMVRTVREWIKDQEVYIYRSDIEEYLTTIV
jgi:hypothetical protein